jgi:hypothetical protein
MILDDIVKPTTINTALFSGALDIDSIAVLQNLRQHLSGKFAFHPWQQPEDKEVLGSKNDAQEFFLICHQPFKGFTTILSNHYLQLID